MKPTFKHLTPKQQATFGNGCTFVPDFIFTASCQQHDYGYVRGGGIYDKLKADFDMCTRMWADSSLWWHYAVTVLYYLGLTLLPISYFFFLATALWKGNYRNNEEILKIDQRYKLKKKSNN